MEDRLRGFYSTDLTLVLGALGERELSQGRVMSAELRRPGSFLSETSFGRDGYSHIVVPACVHPAAFEAIAQTLHVDAALLTKLVSAEVVVVGDGYLPMEDVGWSSDAICGPSGVSELLTRHDPNHPLLKFASIDWIPIPPLCERPFVEGLAKTMVDPWIGPLNELWRKLLAAVWRHDKLVELDAPEIIVTNQLYTVQKLFLEVWCATREPPTLPFAVVESPERRMVPPLAEDVEMSEWDEETMCRITYVNRSQMLVQTSRSVRIVGSDGALLHSLPPSGTLLHGVYKDRFILFKGFVPSTDPTYPEVSDKYGPDHAMYDADGTWRESAAALWRSDMTVLDMREERYLEFSPAGLPQRFFVQMDPELLTLGDQEIYIGGDRPEALAISRDLEFGWAGEEDHSTQVIHLATGIPHAEPQKPEEVELALDLESGEQLPAEDVVDGEVRFTSRAIGFDGERWWLLWSDGVLSTHPSSKVLQLWPPPKAGAFDPTCSELSVLCVTDEREELVTIRLSDFRVESVEIT